MGGRRAIASASSSESSGRPLSAKCRKMAAAFAGPMPGKSNKSRRHEASSCGFCTTRKWASTSLIWACSKKRKPLRTVYGMPSKEFGLQEDTVVVIAIEHGHVSQRQALVAGLEYLLRNERCLLISILGGDE